MFLESSVKKYWNIHVEKSNVAYDLDGWTPLHIAAQYGSTEIFKILAPQVENPNAPNPDELTPLHIAAQYGSTEIFKFLAPQVENPYDPNPFGFTTLQIAKNNNHTEIVEALLQVIGN